MVTNQGSAGYENKRYSGGSALVNCERCWGHGGQQLPRRPPRNRHSSSDNRRRPSLQRRPLLSVTDGERTLIMYIQYRGFSPGAASRIYAYQVVDPPQGTREFTVDVANDAFRSPPFRIQDGPGICFARLKLELDRETCESPAEAHLRITPGDIQEYVEKTYSKPVKKRTAAPNL